jgi:hypothetical protein
MTNRLDWQVRKTLPGWQNHRARTCNVYFAGPILPLAAHAAQKAGISTSRFIAETLAAKLGVKMPPRRTAVSVAARTFKRRMKNAAVLLGVEVVPRPPVIADPPEEVDVLVRCEFCLGKGTTPSRTTCVECKGRGRRHERRSA